MTNEFYSITVLDNAMIYSCMNISLQPKQTFVISQERNDIKEIIQHIGDLSGQIGFGNIDFDYLFLHKLTSGRKYYYESSVRDILFDVKSTLNSILACEEIFGSEYYMQQLDLRKIFGFKATNTTIDDIKPSFGIYVKKPHKNAPIDEWVRYTESNVVAIAKLYFVSVGKTNNPNYSGVNILAPRYEFAKRYRVQCLNESEPRIGERVFIKDFLKKSNRTYESLLKKNQDNFVFTIPEKFNEKEFSPEFTPFLNSLKENRAFIGDISFCGLKIKFGNGGLHAAKQGEFNNKEKSIIDFDIHSMYATIAVAFNIYPRHMSEDFCKTMKELLDERLSLIREKSSDLGKIKLLKGILNSIYGKTQEEKSLLFDKSYSARVIFCTQLLMCYWLSELSKIESVEFLLVNTDGMIIAVDNTHVSDVKSIAIKIRNFINCCISVSFYSNIFIKDVNSYIGIKSNSEIIARGMFDFNKKIGKNSYPIAVKKAVKDYLLFGSDLINIKQYPINDFIITTSSEYDLTFYSKEKEIFCSKTCSYYVTTDTSSGGRIGYKKGKKTNISNVGNIVKLAEDYSQNDIDYNFYISEAEKLLSVFDSKQLTLF